MLATWIQSKKDEDGFTLIELLVVVIIIGILAAIAIPVFLNQRENAWRSAVETDLRNGAIAMETYFTRAGDYSVTTTTIPAASSTDIGEGVQMNASENVTLEIIDNGQTFEIVGTHALLDATENTLVYDSNDGGLANSSFGAPTSTTP